MATDGEEGKGSDARRKPGHSVFGPMILITAGVLLLLSFSNYLPELDWQAVIELWPLLVVFLGLNMVVYQVRRPYGTWLSFLVSSICVVVFSFVLIYSDGSPVMVKLSQILEVKPTWTSISLPAAGIETAEINVTFGAAKAQVHSLEKSQNLLQADISFLDKLIFAADTNQGRAKIFLGSDDNGWLLWYKLANREYGQDDQGWEIALSEEVPIYLDLNMGTETVVLDLRRLELSGLAVEGGTGSTHLLLPGGGYDLFYDVNGGPVEMTLPPDGGHNLSIDGGDGDLTINIPSSVPIQVVVEEGTGQLMVNAERLTQIKLTNEDGQVWQSSGYTTTVGTLNLWIDLGLGEVVIKDQ